MNSIFSPSEWVKLRVIAESDQIDARDRDQRRRRTCNRLIVLLLVLCPMCGFFDLLKSGWRQFWGPDYRSSGSTRYVPSGSEG